MKKVVLWWVMVLFVCLKGFSYEKPSEEELKRLAENRIYFLYLTDKIPEEFVVPFYNETKDSIPLGIELLGIGFHESEWKHFCGKTNENGSYDMGPLMLNSYNLANDWFIEQFEGNAIDYADDLNIYTMIICINYWKDLRLNHGPYNALQVYNGGPRVLRTNVKRDLKRKVQSYANRVYTRINNCSKEWKAKIDSDFDDMFIAFRDQAEEQYRSYLRFVESEGEIVEIDKRGNKIPPSRRDPLHPSPSNIPRIRIFITYHCLRPDEFVLPNPFA